jgi:hypothetical protein
MVLEECQMKLITTILISLLVLIGLIGAPKDPIIDPIVFLGFVGLPYLVYRVVYYIIRGGK